jgi:hypothetical protein
MAKRLVIATAEMGIEALVAKEVRALGYECTLEDGKVYTDCEMEDIPHLNMWLRTADRMKLVVAEIRATRIHPDNVGPNAGAKVMTSPKIPIACPRFSIGKPVKRTFINSGIMIAEPDACIMRAPSRCGKMCACPAIIVPSENNVIAVKYS